MKIYCCGCGKDVKAKLVTGADVYPHRPDLSGIPFWRCPTCLNYVGTHHKTKTPTMPLGNIPTPELRKARNHVHAILDPLWKGGHMKRKAVYKSLSKSLGYEYHTAQIKSVEDARIIYNLIKEIWKCLPSQAGT